MNINELFESKLAEGLSLGHAQWIVGNNLLTGRKLEENQDEAEKWFLKAWDNGFPGTASTETFILRRLWQSFVAAEYSDKPRKAAILNDARVSASEEIGRIVIPSHNDAQKEWLNEKLSDLICSFRRFTTNRFVKLTITIE